MPDTLTSLADCKAWLGLATSTDDALLGALIGDVGRSILADIGRAAGRPCCPRPTSTRSTAAAPARSCCANGR